MDPDEVRDKLKFAEELGQLKHIDRRGWILRQVPFPERIAGHMYRMAVMAMTLKPIENCDINKVIKQCLVHDLPECRVGDITPHDNVTEEDKHRSEREAMEDLCKLIRGDEGKVLMDIYTEYEDRETVESRLTKDLDKYDMVHQAFEYEKRCISQKISQQLDLNEFFHEKRVLSTFDNPQIKCMVQEIMSQRRQFWQQNSSHPHAALVLNNH